MTMTMYDKADQDNKKKRSVEAVADVNNQGVAHFKIGDLSGALICFRAALQASKVAFSDSGCGIPALSPTRQRQKDLPVNGNPAAVTNQWLPSTPLANGTCSLPTSSAVHSTGTENGISHRRTCHKRTQNAPRLVVDVKVHLRAISVGAAYIVVEVHGVRQALTRRESLWSDFRAVCGDKLSSVKSSVRLCILQHLLRLSVGGTVECIIVP